MGRRTGGCGAAAEEVDVLDVGARGQVIVERLCEMRCSVGVGRDGSDSYGGRRMREGGAPPNPKPNQRTDLEEGPVEGAGLRDEHELVLELGPALGVGVRLQLVPEGQAPHFL